MRHQARLSTAVPHKHGLLAAGVHRDVAADAGGVRRGRIDREHQAARSAASATRRVTTPASARMVALERSVPGSGSSLRSPPRRLEFFGVDDRGPWRERHGAAGVAGAAAARNDGEAEFDAIAHQPGNLGLRIRRQHDERHIDAPVGGIRDMRDPRVGVEADVVARAYAGRAAAARFLRSATMSGKCASKRCTAAGRPRAAASPCRRARPSWRARAAAPLRAGDGAAPR